MRNFSRHANGLQIIIFTLYPLFFFLMTLTIIKSDIFEFLQILVKCRKKWYVKITWRLP